MKDMAIEPHEHAGIRQVKLVCPDCNGKKVVDYDCSSCYGSGEGMHEGQTCRACKGRGRITAQCETCEETGER